MGAETQEVKITYETLFELMRREKIREELQEMAPNFFSEVLDYLVEKQKIFDETKHKTDLFSSQERETTLSQIKNVHRILRELYDRREFKVIMMAINKARTGSKIINTMFMLKEEVLLFERLVSEMSIFRTGILENMLALRGVSLIDHEFKETPHSMIQPEPQSTQPPTESQQPEPQPAQQETGSFTDLNPNTRVGGQPTPEASESMSRKIKILEDVPKFIGPDLDSFGPYNKEQEIDIPSEIAKLLINKGSAVEL